MDTDANHEEGKLCERFLCHVGGWGRGSNERPNTGGASIGKRNSAPSRKRSAANAPMTRASNK